MKGFPGGSDVKESACNAGDPGLIPGLGRSPGEENGCPLQYSCLENPMDRGAWRATVHGVAKSQTQLIDWAFGEWSEVYMNLLLFSCSVRSDSLWPHGLQHSRLPCPSPSPRACSNSCPLSQWCHPTISSSVVPFSCPHSFPSFNEEALCIKWPKYWSFSLSISPSNEYSRLISFRIDWFDQLSVQGTLNSLLPHIWISTDKLGETLTYFKPSFSLKTLSQNQSQSFVFNGLYC